jgi:cyanophycinase-like exopeptidase
MGGIPDPMADEKPDKIYLLSGGRRVSRDDVDPVLEEVLRHLGKPSPSIAYVGVANGDSDDFFQWMVHDLQKAGAGEVKLARLADRHADPGEARKLLNAANCVFIGGGDVSEGMRLLEEKDMISFLLHLYNRGIPFLGRSAGSIMLSRCWIRWRDPDDEATGELFPCLGFAGVLCDTHGEGEGWEELHSLLRLAGNDQVGYGIPTGLAMCVHPDETVEALGGAVSRYIHRDGKIRRMADLLPSSG